MTAEYVVPNGNEEEFVAVALELGITELIFLYEDTKLPSLPRAEGITCSTARLSSKPLQNTVTVALGTTLSVLQKGISYVYGLEDDPKKDGLHQRRSGANEVLFGEMEQKKIGYLVSYALLQNKKQQVTTLGRLQQNIALAKKKNISIVLTSLAHSPEELRSPTDVNALKRILRLE